MENILKIDRKHLFMTEVMFEIAVKCFFDKYKCKPIEITLGFFDIDYQALRQSMLFRYLDSNNEEKVTRFIIAPDNTKFEHYKVVYLQGITQHFQLFEFIEEGNIKTVKLLCFKAQKSNNRFKKNQKVWVTMDGANSAYIRFKWRGTGRYVNGVINKWDDSLKPIKYNAIIGEDGFKEIGVDEDFANRILK